MKSAACFLFLLCVIFLGSLSFSCNAGQQDQVGLDSNHSVDVKSHTMDCTLWIQNKHSDL